MYTLSQGSLCFVPSQRERLFPSSCLSPRLNLATSLQCQSASAHDARGRESGAGLKEPSLFCPSATEGPVPLTSSSQVFGLRIPFQITEAPKELLFTCVTLLLFTVSVIKTEKVKTCEYTSSHLISQQSNTIISCHTAGTLTRHCETRGEEANNTLLS